MTDIGYLMTDVEDEPKCTCEQGHPLHECAYSAELGYMGEDFQYPDCTCCPYCTRLCYMDT